MTEERIAITQQILNAGKNQTGGWTRAQVEVLGVDWPFTSGWRKRIIGTEVSAEVIRKFYALRDCYLPEDERPFDRTEGIDEPERDQVELERMRNASGRVTDDRPLVIFLYLLLRDQLAAGVIEPLADQALGPERRGNEVVFTNGWLAQHAQDLADRLTGGEGDSTLARERGD